MSNGIEVRPGDGIPADTEVSKEEHYANMIANALEATGLITKVKEVKFAVGQMYFLCRVDKAAARRFVRGPGEGALRRFKGHCQVFVGTQYFIDEDTDELRFGWLVGFTFDPTELREVVEGIDAVLSKYTSKIEVLESPLMGPGTPSGGPGRGKGAAPIRG